MSKRIQINTKKPLPNLSAQQQTKLPNFIASKTPPKNINGLLDLPERIRVKILSYLSRKERARAQLVCRKFRNEMRMRVGLQSRVSDLSRQGLIFMRDVVVDSIVVGRFTQPTLTPAQIIGHPDTVKELIFEEPITIPLLDAFVSRCDRVQHVVITAAPLEALHDAASYRPGTSFSDGFRTWESISKIPIKLKCLLSLSLIIPGRKALFVMQKLLTVVQGPSLRKLAVCIGDEHEKVDSRAVHSRIFVLLKRMPKLTHLFLATYPAAGLKVPESAHFLGFSKTEILELSNGIQLKGLVLTESVIVCHIWNLFLSIQKELEIFQVMHPLPLKVVTPIIENNFRTLKKVAIHIPLWQRDGQLTPLNMEIFKECVLLEELMVDLSSKTSRGDWGDDAGIPNIILLRELPKSLRVLSLRDCAFLTLDLLQMRQHHRKIHSLALICMEDLGHFPGFGVSFRALLHLLRYPALNELLVTEIRGNERDKHVLRRMKHALKAGLKQNRNGIYVPHDEPAKCHWLIGPDNSYNYRFATDWGISTTYP